MRLLLAAALFLATAAQVHAQPQPAAQTEAEQLISRDYVLQAHAHACNYYDNRTRANSEIATPGEPHFVDPPVEVCRLIDTGGWLTDPAYTGSMREQVAANFALRGIQALVGLQKLTTIPAGNQGMRMLGYGDTTLLLVLQHEKLFDIARHARRLSHVETVRMIPPAR